MYELIAFDADDTLWHNERLFLATEVQFRDLPSPYHSAVHPLRLVAALTFDLKFPPSPAPIRGHLPVLALCMAGQSRRDPSTSSQFSA